MKSAPAFRRGLLPAAISLFIAAPTVHGGEIEVSNPDLNVRLDTTLKYSAAVRLKNAAPALIDPAAGNSTVVNSDDGDRNFRRGRLVSNRVDLLTEFDLVYRKDFGVRLSGAAWFDQVYNRGNSNDSPATANALSTRHDQFPGDTRELHGRKAEVLDTFGFANFNLGSTRAQLKAGRHTLLWGESLFFAQNGIASGQAPFDIVKLLSVPSTPAKEFVLPVGQLSGQVQFSPDLAVAGYYQFEWRRTRLPAAGSYFSTSDILDAGGETLLFAPAHMAYLRRGADVTPPRTGQFGLALKTRVGGSDVGLYALQYNAKTPVLYGNLTPGPQAEQGEYSLVFPQKIKVFGASANYTAGAFNFAGEASVRRNAPLTSGLAMRVFGSPLGDGASNPLYAVGNTGHVNLNTMAILGPSFVSTSAVFLAEVAWNRMLSCAKNCNTTLDPGAARDSWGFRFTYSPTYYNVADGLDVSPSISASYFPKGKAAAQTLGPHHGGDVTLGADLTYLTVWKAAINYTHFYGPADAFLNARNTYSFAQSSKDRDFVSFTLSRTF